MLYRVLKTYRQVNGASMSYPEAVRRIVDGGGWTELFGRGLQVTYGAMCSYFIDVVMPA